MSVHVLLFMLRTCAQGADSRQWVLSGRDVSRRPQHEHQTKVVVANGVGVSVDTGAYYCYSSLRWRSHSAPALWRRRESAWVLRYQGVENDVIFVLRGPRRDSGSSPFIGFLSFSPFLYQHCLSVLSNSAYVSQLFHSLVVRFFHCIQIHFHSLKFKSLHVFFLLVFFFYDFPGPSQFRVSQAEPCTFSPLSSVSPPFSPLFSDSRSSEIPSLHFPLWFRKRFLTSSV